MKLVCNPFSEQAFSIGVGEKLKQFAGGGWNMV